jgi:hypothetical protein
MPPAGKTAVTPLYVGTDHCVAMYLNMLLMVVHEDPHADLPEHQQRWIAKLQREVGGDLGFMVVLRPDNPPPKEAARATIRRAFQQFGGAMSFGAVVVEKTGFTAAAQRSALSVMILAARPKYPLKVFGSVREAVAWIAEHSKKTTAVAEQELIAVVEELKKAYDTGTFRVS